jgi:hypothetical protein
MGVVRGTWTYLIHVMGKVCYQEIRRAHVTIPRCKGISTLDTAKSRIRSSKFIRTEHVYGSKIDGSTCRSGGEIQDLETNHLCSRAEVRNVMPGTSR